jgi:cell division protease FtsH
MEDKNKKDKQQKKQTWLMFLICAGITVVMLTIFSTLMEQVTTKEIYYNEFIDMLEAGNVEEIQFKSSGKIVITPKESEGSVMPTTYWTIYLDDPDLIETLKEQYPDVKFKGDMSDTKTSFLSYLLPFVLVYGAIYLLFRHMMKSAGGGGGIMGVGKSNAKVYVEKETGVTFKDVAGQDEAKESLNEIVDILHDPGKYTRIGAKLPKGALLVGPPGTGKTLLAKAVAGEAKVPFFSLAGSDFVEMFVGVGASRVRDLFKQAQKQAPCIIFIDEIDAIGKSRDSRFGGNDEREQTLNQLLAEMDGFDASKGVVILAATNRPEVLDQALLRPGRFDRRVIVDKPDLKGRVDTLRVHSKNVKMDDTVDLEAIGLATSGAVGSDLANMINEAAINAVKHGRNAISQADLFESVEVVIAGKEKKDRILSPEEKKTVAYHEIGHALVTALEKDAEPVQKITIVPRTMGSLGYVMQVPEEEKYLMRKDELEAKLTTLLGGRAAESVVFDSVTTGASNDIERATKLARAMITQYGMSERFGLMSLETIENQYLGGATHLECSDATSALVDDEVQKMLEASYERAVKLIEDNRPVLDKLAEFLYKKETITGAQFMEIFHLVQDGKQVTITNDGEIEVEYV